MSTFEQVLELIETLTPEELVKLRAHLDKLIADNAWVSQKQILGLHAPRQLGTLAEKGEHWISPDFDEYLDDDFWLGDENDPLYR